MNEIINRVAQSTLVTMNLEEFLPAEPLILFDIRDFLFRGLVLREKEYREALSQVPVQDYAGKMVGITCSADAIVPIWAYMLAAALLQPYARDLIFGDQAALLRHVLLKNLSRLDPEAYRDQRVVLKGCGDREIPTEAYVEATRILRPVAKSLLYGEACSNIPIFKKNNLP